MRYLLKQKFFSLADEYIIKDENDNNVFFVKGKLFSLGNKLSFQNLYGDELLFISQKLLSLETRYEIYRDESLFAVITKKLFSFLNCIFTIELHEPGEYKAEGDFFDYEYIISSEGIDIALISKQWVSFTDTYGIEINPGNDDALILACAVIIDLVCHDDQQR